ncbi:MAG TPA: fumarylacetoacetate hydrolase family protein [Atribacteraceae bacterium]|nr:fumarylacetoacetate hydrolase family protein [Atribacteraceae bacterium]
MKLFRFYEEDPTRVLFGYEKEAGVLGEIVDPYELPVRETGRIFLRERIRLLAPILPTKIIAVGLNYHDHIAEMGHALPTHPVLFMKPPTAVVGPDDLIRLPRISERVDYEAELAVVIGKKTKSVTPASALDRVLGYTCFNDVTARDLQRLDGQWTRAKSFDGFAPLGPHIETDLDPRNLEVACLVNGLIRQRSRTSQLLFPVPELIAFVSQVMTLLPGDVIATGTPAGVGPLRDGDTVEIRIEGIGSLSNPVQAE